MPPRNSILDQNILSAIVGAADSKMRQNAPAPDAIISQTISNAPFTFLLCHARNAPKKETSAVTRKKREYMVKN